MVKCRAFKQCKQPELCGKMHNCAWGAGSSVEPVLVVYLRLLDAGTDNACWRVCAKGDHGAIPFTPVES